MRRIEYPTVVLTGLLLCLPLSVIAQQPKVEEKDGHLSPVMVKIVFLNDSSRTMMLRGIGTDAGNNFLTHQFGVQTDGGASKRTIWLDSIATIEGTGTMRTRGSEFTVTLKDGKKISAIFAGHDCSTNMGAPEYDCRTLFTHNEDDGDQKIDLQKVKSVQFLGPARKDKAGNAMFDTWRYSPFTGEKLPQ
jgi:hypothetical protein